MADFRGFRTGLKAAVIASSCCSLPLMFAVLFSAAGAGSMAAALKIPAYKTYFTAAGTVFLAASLYLTIRGRRGSCTIGDVKNQWTLVLTSLATYIGLTLLLIYLILPVLAELAFSAGS